MLRRLKPLGATTEELLEVFDKQIRCIAEFVSPFLTAGLTADENNQIERIQKCAFAIILAENYTCSGKNFHFPEEFSHCLSD